MFDFIYIYLFLFSYYFNSTRGHTDGFQRSSRTERTDVIIFFFISDIIRRHASSWTFKITHLKRQFTPEMIIWSFTHLHVTPNLLWSLFMQSLSLKWEQMWLLKGKRNRIDAPEVFSSLQLSFSRCVESRTVNIIQKKERVSDHRAFICRWTSPLKRNRLMDVRDSFGFVVWLSSCSVFLKTLLHSRNIIF